METEQICYCVQTIFVEVSRSYLGLKNWLLGFAYFSLVSDIRKWGISVTKQERLPPHPSFCKADVVTE